MAAWISMSLGMELGLGPGDFVLDGDPASLFQKGAEPRPQFSAHFYCGQTAGWINMALGMEVGLGPVHIVLDGDTAHLPKKGTEPRRIFWPRRLCVRWGPSPLPQKGRSPTQFSAYVCCGQTAAWIKMPLSTELGLGLRDIVFNVDPVNLQKRAHPAPPNFWPMSIVAKWLDG